MAHLLAKIILVGNNQFSLAFERPSTEEVSCAFAFVFPFAFQNTYTTRIAHYVVSLWFSSLCHHSGMPPATFLARYISSGIKGQICYFSVPSSESQDLSGPYLHRTSTNLCHLVFVPWDVLAFHRRQRSCEWDPLAGFGGPTCLTVGRAGGRAWTGSPLASGPPEIVWTTTVWECGGVSRGFPPGKPKDSLGVRAEPTQVVSRQALLGTDLDLVSYSFELVIFSRGIILGQLF